MPYRDLRDFLAMLEAKQLLIRIKEPVSSILEITEIHKRVLHAQGPALLFEKVYDQAGKLSPIPVLVNLFGTKERIAYAMQTTEDGLTDVGNMLAFLKQPDMPSSLKETYHLLPLLKKITAMKPKTIRNAPCQEIVLKGEEVDLSLLPIQTCWPNEPAPLITWPLVVTKGLTGKGEDNYNLGIYRMQVTGKNTTLMRWLKHRGGAQQHQRWKEKSREPFPAAAVIGADPATILAAVTPIPETLSEYQFSGLLRSKKVELVDCQTVPLKVPAYAEIVLEGYVSLTEYGNEGPYGDHTGYYNSVESFPIFTVTAMTMRKNPIYLSTYTGKPPDEPSVLGEALNDVFVPLLTQQFPEIVDFYLPPEGCSYRVAIVSMKKAYPGHAKRIMMGVWSFLRQFMYTKFVIIVDEDINIRDWKEVIWAISTRVDPKRDTIFVEQTPIDYLDFASPESGLGSKMGLDATNKWDPETKREWGKTIEMNPDIVQKVTDKWSDYGLDFLK